MKLLKNGTIRINGGDENIVPSLYHQEVTTCLMPRAIPLLFRGFSSGGNNSMGGKRQSQGKEDDQCKFHTDKTRNKGTRIQMTDSIGLAMIQCISITDKPMSQIYLAHWHYCWLKKSTKNWHNFVVNSIQQKPSKFISKNALLHGPLLESKSAFFLF